MSKNIQINISSTGIDLGPYNLFFINSFGVITPGPTNISKQVLTNGYQLTVEDTIVKVRVKSVNAQCSSYYVDLTVPPTPPPPPSISCPTTIRPYNPEIEFPNYNPQQERIIVTIGNTSGIVYYGRTGDSEQVNCRVPIIYYPPVENVSNIINNTTSYTANRFFHFEYDPAKGTDVLVLGINNSC